MKFKLKNIVLVSMLGIAGLLGVTSVFLSKQSKEIPVAEKVEASSDSSTSTSTWIYWNWKNYTIKPYISYELTNGTWKHLNKMSGDDNLYNGTAYYQVPANTRTVIFVHSNNGTEWTRQTENLSIQADSGKILNVFETDGGGSSKFSGSWRYSACSEETTIFWKTSGSWWIKPYVQYLKDGTWHGPYSMKDANGTSITTNVQNCVSQYAIPEGTNAVVFEHDNWSGKTYNQFIYTDPSTNKVKNLCTSTCNGSSFTAEWTATFNSEDGIYVKPCSDWSVSTSAADNVAATRVAVSFFGEVFGGEQAFTSTWMTVVPGQTTYFEGQVPGTNKHYSQCIVLKKDGVKRTDAVGYSGGNLDQTGNLSGYYCGFNCISISNEQTDQWYRKCDSVDMSYTDNDRALSWGLRFNTVHVICQKVPGTITTDNWSTAKTEYQRASKTTQGIIWLETADEQGNNLQKALAKYDYIINKYPSKAADNFVKRTVSSSGAKAFLPLSLFGSEDNFSTVIIIVSSSVALLSVTALSILVIRKRKSKEQ